MIGTGIILTIMFGLFYLQCKKGRGIRSMKVVFVVLACMVIPNLIGCKFLEFFDITINYFDTFIFGLLIISGLVPWLYYDRYLTSIKKRELIASKNSIGILKLLCVFLIITSFYCIIYLLPYAIMGVMMDTADLRNQLQNGDYLLPKNIFTTISVGFAAFNIYCIPFFFLTFCIKALKIFRIPLLISSLSNVVSAAAFSGRDQYVVLILFIIIFYIIFKPFIISSYQTKIKRIIFIIGGGAIFVMGIYTTERFFNDKTHNDINYLLVGTVGYIAEQPLVFNSYIEKENDFIGLESKFPLLNDILDLPYKKRSHMQPYTWQFGTMYAAFYSIGGWTSLILFSLSFFMFYSIGMKYLCRRKLFFQSMLLFVVYLYLEITGLFYLKAAGTILINLFYALLSILPFCIGNLVTVKKSL